MGDGVTQILSRIESGDTGASKQLLPLVYQELRQLAAHKLAQEKPGHTLQPTALVHEAYLRLVGDGQQAGSWDNRGHWDNRRSWDDDDDDDDWRERRRGRGLLGQLFDGLGD